MARIDADVLIPGRGAPIEKATVITDGAAISYAGPRDAAPPDAGAADVTVPVLMPGMWDCHGHFTGERRADLSLLAQVHPALVGARCAGDATATLRAGFTSVREVGGIGVHLRRAIDEGTVVGPSIYAAGAILSPSGGHADLHMYPIGWVHDLTERLGCTYLCDGVPECLKAVRMQLRLGAELIKICASGGVLSEVDHPIHQQFSADELRAIVEEAARAERIVAAHCHGKPGMVAALEAGVKTIEHGSYLDEEVADMMLELHATLVPTRYVVELLLSEGKEMGLPDYAYRKATALADRHFEALQIAIDKGVRIALGTDIAGSGADIPGHWGTNAEELILLVKAGMSAERAIESATANGPVTLGPRGPRSGQVKEGYDADLIAVTANPLDDVSILTDHDAITHVWKAGELRFSPDPAAA